MPELTFEMYQRPHSPTENRWWVKDSRGVARLATAEEVEMYHLLLSQERARPEKKRGV